MRRPGRWPALLVVALGLAAGTALLLADAQWLVLGLVLLCLAGFVVAVRSGFATRAAASLQDHETLARSVAVVATIVLVACLHDRHFPLLLLATVLLQVLACLGLTLQFGYAGVVNFAAAAFAGIGAYTAAVAGVRAGVPGLLLPLLGGAASALVGCVLLLPLLRTRGHYAALITIAFGLLFRTGLEVNDLLGGPQGLKVPGLVVAGFDFNRNIDLPGDDVLSYYVWYALAALLLAAGAGILVRRLERSWIGLALDAVRLDETAARVFGIHPARWRIFAFLAGNLLVGTAGALQAMMTGFVAPTNFGFADSLVFVSVLILGGLGNPAGLLPAAVLVVVLPEKLQAIQEYRVLLFALVVMLLLRFRPGGLFPRGPRRYFPGSPP